MSQPMLSLAAPKSSCTRLPIELIYQILDNTLTDAYHQALKHLDYIEFHDTIGNLARASRWVLKYVRLWPDRQINLARAERAEVHRKGAHLHPRPRNPDNAQLADILKTKEDTHRLDVIHLIMQRERERSGRKRMEDEARKQKAKTRAARTSYFKLLEELKHWRKKYDGIVVEIRKVSWDKQRLLSQIEQLHRKHAR